jgi:opacity protein-like surface antigen
MKRVFAIAFVLAAWAASAQAQQRPLVTEDPETIGAGLVLLEGGIDEQREVFYPASGLQGDLLRVPTLGVSFGISSIAELQIDGGLYSRLSITSREDAPLSNQLDFTGNSTHAVEDIVVATKIRILSETAGRPAFGIRLATKLPNASNESGLGLDTTDFYVAGLVGKTVQSIRFVGNLGLGILGDPVRGDRQNDVLTFGASVARAVRQGLEIVGEINGRLDTRRGEAPVGTESRGAMRIGGRFTRSTVRADAGLIFGMTSKDPSIGVTAGLTWVFKGFTIP